MKMNLGLILTPRPFSYGQINDFKVLSSYLNVEFEP